MAKDARAKAELLRAANAADIEAQELFDACLEYEAAAMWKVARKLKALAQTGGGI